MDKEFKLNSLLEITKAINANMVDEKLYKLFEFVLKNQLKIRKCTLLSVDGLAVKTLLNYGESEGGKKVKISLNEDLLPVKDIKTLGAEHKLHGIGYHAILPIYHNATVKAFLMLGEPDLKEDFKVSPIVKNLRFIQTLANVIIVAIENRKLNEQRIENERLRREIELAREMQQMLIPKALPTHKKIDVSAFYRPHSGVGGDYYDLIQKNESLFWGCVADISGKGVSAALLMANLQANFRAIIAHSDDISEVIAQLNSKVFETTKGEKFITLFLVKIDLAKGQLSYFNAGHPAAMFRVGSKVTSLSSGGPMLGILEELPVDIAEPIALSDSSIITIFTDGIQEAMNVRGEIFDEPRIKKLLLQQPNNISMRDFNLLLMEQVQDFLEDEPFNDDVALMSIRFKY